MTEQHRFRRRSRTACRRFEDALWQELNYIPVKDSENGMLLLPSRPETFMKSPPNSPDSTLSLKDDSNDNTNIEGPSRLYDVPTPHPDFWLYDGSIVLSVESCLFRVHQTILANHSEVFADLFTVPQPEEEGEEMIDGCRIVHLSDNENDFVDLLNAIYRPECVHLFASSTLTRHSNLLSVTLIHYVPMLTWTPSSPLSKESSASAPSTSSGISANVVSLFFSVNFLVLWMATHQKPGFQIEKNTNPITSCRLSFSHVKIMSLKYSLTLSIVSLDFRTNGY